MEEEDITEVMPRMVMDFVRQRERRDEAQQAIESMVKKVGYFNENEVPKFLEAYNAKMTKRDVDAAMRLKCFFRVMAVPMYKEVKGPQEAHDS